MYTRLDTRLRFQPWVLRLLSSPLGEDRGHSETPTAGNWANMYTSYWEKNLSSPNSSRTRMTFRTFFTSSPGTSNTNLWTGLSGNLTGLDLFPLLSRVGSPMASSTVLTCPSLSWFWSLIHGRLPIGYVGGCNISWSQHPWHRDPCEVGVISNVTGDFGDTIFSNSTKTRWQDVMIQFSQLMLFTSFVPFLTNHGPIWRIRWVIPGGLSLGGINLWWGCTALL